MKFDEYIAEQRRGLGVISEAVEPAQQSNALKDFLKSLSTIASGGEPADPATIELKDPSRIEELKKILTPTYEDASLQVANVSDPVVIDNMGKINANLVVYNLLRVFETAAISRNSERSTDIYNLLEIRPNIKNVNSKSTGKKGVLDLGISSTDLENQIKAILNPAIQKGIIKWDVPVRRFSPEDLFNRFINKATGVAKDTASHLVNQDTAARM